MSLIKSVPLMFTWRFVRPPASLCRMATWGKVFSEYSNCSALKIITYFTLYSLRIASKFFKPRWPFPFFFFLFLWKSICPQTVPSKWERIYEKITIKLVVSEAWLWGPRGFPKHNLSILLIPAKTLPLPSVCTRPSFPRPGSPSAPRGHDGGRERLLTEAPSIIYLTAPPSADDARTPFFLSTPF